MIDNEAGAAAEGAAEEGGTQSQMGGQTATTLTISGTFTSGVNASLDMSGIDDMAGDNEVDIYAATGTAPTSRRTGTADRRGHYSPAPSSFSTDLDGGSWTNNGTYWVQVTDQVARNGAWNYWEGSITATAGTHTITLTKKT